MNLRIQNPQLIVLFLCHLAILFTGMGLFPILPLYAARYGADATITGFYLAFTYLSITAGTMLTGWLAGRVERRQLFLLAGLAGIPAVVLMGAAAQLWQVFLLTGLIWFTGGVGIALVNVFTGLHAGENERGKAYGLQSLASPLGAILGGALVGWLVETRGYPVMYTALALIWTAWPILAVFAVKDRAPGQAPARAGAANTFNCLPAAPSSSFTFLLLAVLLVAVAVSVSRLGMSLVMKEQVFSAADVSSTSVVAGLGVLPILLFTRGLSDRLGQRLFLAASYLGAVAGALLLINASHLYQYWLAATLLLAAQSINRSQSYALATVLVSREALARRLPWVGTVNWAASIIGFAMTGAGLVALGGLALFGLIALLPVAAIVLTLFLVRKPARQPQVEGAAGLAAVDC